MREKMKKLLLASTALVASVGIAAAEVSVSGSAEIGIFGGNADDGAAGSRGDVETQYHTDVEVTFAMTGESDGGLAFGATVQLDEPGAADETDDGGATWFLAYQGLRLDMGDTDGAFDAALQEVALAGGSIRDDETEHAGYNGNSGLDGQEDGQIARVSYSIDAFTAHFSVELDDDGGSDPIYGLGVRYSGDLGGVTLGVGLGYQQQNDWNGSDDSLSETDVSVVGISVDAKFANGFSAAVNYSEADVDGADIDPTHFGIGVGYTMNALSIGLNYGEYEDWALGCGDCTGFGIAATYDLGGGLAAHAGYGSSDPDGDDNDYDSFSLGLSMSV
jgi:outer membrane protein OmpU